MQKPTVQQLIDLLNLEPLPQEGGLFRSTYRSRAQMDGIDAGSAIYYLLTGDAFSHMHRLPGEELYHFYLGDPVELLELFEDGNARTVLLGPDLLEGQKVQHLVSAGVWQGSHLAAGGSYALLGTTMCPGYYDSGYEHGNFKSLSAQYPAQLELLKKLTHSTV